MSETFEAGKVAKKEFDGRAERKRKGETTEILRQAQDDRGRAPDREAILGEEDGGEHRPRPVCESRTAETWLARHSFVGTRPRRPSGSLPPPHPQRAHTPNNNPPITLITRTADGTHPPAPPVEGSATGCRPAVAPAAHIRRVLPSARLHRSAATMKRGYNNAPATAKLGGLTFIAFRLRILGGQK